MFTVSLGNIQNPRLTSVAKHWESDWIFRTSLTTSVYSIHSCSSVTLQFQCTCLAVKPETCVSVYHIVTYLYLLNTDRTEPYAFYICISILIIVKKEMEEQ